MTISNEYAPLVYDGNGVTTLFPITFVFYNSSEILATRRQISTGVDAPLAITTDFTVSGGAGSTGSLTALVAPTLDQKIIIERALPYKQEANFSENTAFPAETLETALDKSVIMAQQTKALAARALVIPSTDTGVTTVLPTSTVRAGKALFFDGSGNPSVTSTVDTISAAAAAASASAAATSAANAATAQAAAEAASTGIRWRPSVKAATTANIALSGPQTIDSVSCIAGDRVLVKDQSTSSQNGVYIVAAGSWTRATDADTWAELVSQAVSVEQGAANADSQWICTSDAGGTLGVTAVTWAPFLANPRPLSVTYGSINTSAIGTNADLIAGTASKLVDATTLENFLRPYDVTNSPTSGTTSLFTGIPTGVRRVKITIQNLSHTTSATRYGMTIGPVAGLETSSYASVASFSSTVVSSTTSTTDFILINSAAASSPTFGIIELSLVEDSTNTWVMIFDSANSGAAATLYAAGQKAIAGPLERLSINLGGNAFASGRIRVEAFYI